MSRRRWAVDLAIAVVLLLAAPTLVAGAPAPAAAPPGAFDLLQRMRRAYAAAGTYRDHGEIESVAASGARVRRRFETLISPAGFRFTVETGDGLDAHRQVLWGEGHRAFHYDSALAEVRPADSLLAELVTVLGEGSLDLLLVPALLASGGETLSDPAGASVDAPAPCEGGSCHVVTLSPVGGGVETKLWLDARSDLIRRLEVRYIPSGVGAPAAGRWVSATVEHHVDAVGAPVSTADLAFTIPAGTARVSRFSTLGQEGAAPGGSPLAEAMFGEVVNVQLFSIAVRALNDGGDPILGLQPADFRARLGDKEIPVASVDWHAADSSALFADRPAGSAEPAQPGAPAVAPSATAGGSEPGVWPPEPALAPQGRLVVFFVQADINSPTRTRGQLATLPYARDLIATFLPEDRIAVVSFDSHLKLWLDFTADHGAVYNAVGRAIRFGGQPALPQAPQALPREQPGPSLARHFDFAAALDAASPERALKVTGDALTPVPGEKELIYLGWGLGYLTPIGVRMGRDYGPAISALEAARATVFVLDITDARSHDLEVGLQKVAKATGGTYAKTFDFPSQATGRLARAISGYYVVSFDAEKIRAGGRLVLELAGRPGQLLYRPISIQ